MPGALSSKATPSLGRRGKHQAILLCHAIDDQAGFAVHVSDQVFVDDALHTVA